MTPRLLSCVFVAVLVLTAVLPSASEGSSGETECSTLALVPRGSISIFEESDFTAENGVVSGSGSSSDPYIIEGWELRFNNSGTGVTVVDSDKYFVVRNVHIIAAKIGFRFEGVYHARVTDCTIENCSIGVSASYSEVSKVDHNLIANCSIGISMRYCDAFKESDNTFVNNEQNLRVVALPWIETRQADLVFAIIAVTLGAFVLGLLYLRYKSMRPPEERP